MTDLVLSQEQAEAVESEARALVVVAGAGSGKTEVLARRIERMLTESPGDDFRILAVSFTVKAADELRERLATRLGKLHRRVDADTVHGFALSIIRSHGTRIGLPLEPEVLVRNEDRVELLVNWLESLGMRAPDDAAEVLSRLDLARARCEDAPLLDEWRAALAGTGGLDYPAMLERGLELLEDAWVSRTVRRLYGQVVVDESQNLTRAQYRLLRAVIGNPGEEQLGATLVGDVRQSIVGFAGADPTLISEFAEEYSAVKIELHANFRSARRIALLGGRISEVLGHPLADEAEVTYPAEGSIEVRVHPTEDAEGAAVAALVEELLREGLPPTILAAGERRSLEPEEVAVLARSAAALRSTKDALAGRGIAFAQSSTSTDWLSSVPAQMVVELIAHLSAPSHRSTLSRLHRLAGLSGSPNVGWPDAAARSPDLAIQCLAALDTRKGPQALLQSLRELPVEDPDWLIDLAELDAAWDGFVDRVDSAERTYGNFRQHILRWQRGDSLDAGVRLLTVHKAQGREFRVVVLVGCTDGQFPDFRATSEKDRLSELRTFYVAVTRASRSLVLSMTTTRHTRLGTRVVDPSPFLQYASHLAAR